MASILSKKLAEGIDGLVLVVKVGRGAFMKDAKSARKLAQTLVRVGTRSDKGTGYAQKQGEDGKRGDRTNTAQPARRCFSLFQAPPQWP